MEGLGLAVGAMLLAGLAAVPFALGMLIARDAPRWLVASSAVGCLLGLLVGAAMLSEGVRLVAFPAAFASGARAVGLVRA